MLSAGERTTLKKRVRGAKTPCRDRLRAQIVLAAARGRGNARIARDLGISQDTARKWRGRFAVRGLDGLADLPRPGRPRRISEMDRAAVVALACQLPAATGVPLGRWTGPELTAELAARGLARPMSASSVLRILADHPVKPWQYQSWIYPRDPDFEAKAKVIVDLYQGCHQGPLGPGDRILSFDAKPSIKARGRRHPTLPAAPGKPVREEHEYIRQGALALLAGLDVQTGRCCLDPRDHRDQAVHGPRRPGDGPAGVQNAPRVFVIVDNGSDHRGQAAISRLLKAHPNAIMIHTPVHASWLNQIEIFFSIIQKKVVSPNDFASLGQLSRDPAGLRRPLQPDRPAVQLGTHCQRPARTHGHASANARAGGSPAARSATGGRLTPPTNLWRHPLKGSGVGSVQMGQGKAHGEGVAVWPSPSVRRRRGLGGGEWPSTYGASRWSASGVLPARSILRR